MAARFHINPATGEPGLCKAEVSCPFGSPEEHHPTLPEARAAYEQQMATLSWPDLQQVAEVRSEWRSIPWEKRKKFLDKLARKLVSQGAVPGKRKFVVHWEDDFATPGKLGGAGFVEESVPYIRLPEARMELLEATAAHENVFHEVAHLVEGAEGHEDATWRKGAKELATKHNILSWHDFPEGSQLSPQENFRLNYLWYSRRTPRFVGVCSNDSLHRYQAQRASDRNPTCFFCDEAGADGYLTVKWGELSTPEARRKWIFDKMNENGWRSSE